MEAKTSKAVALFQQGMLSKSLSIFKTFRIGFTKEEKRTLEIASDCLNGRSLFYEQLGVDVENTILFSKSIIRSKYSL